MQRSRPHIPHNIYICATLDQCLDLFHIPMMACEMERAIAKGAHLIDIREWITKVWPMPIVIARQNICCGKLTRIICWAHHLQFLSIQPWSLEMPRLRFAISFACRLGGPGSYLSSHLLRISLQSMLRCSSQILLAQTPRPAGGLWSQRSWYSSWSRVL